MDRTAKHAIENWLNKNIDTKQQEQKNKNVNLKNHKIGL